MNNTELLHELNNTPVEDAEVILGHISNMLAIAFDEVDDIFRYNTETSKSCYLNTSTESLHTILSALQNFLNEAKENAVATEEQIQKIKSQLNGKLPA